MITVPVGSAIDLNKTASAPLVCLFPPDYYVVQTLTRIFDQYRLGRSSEVRAAWVLASIYSQRRYIELAYLKGVRSHGSNPNGVPCGHRLLLDNSRFHDLDDINVSGFEFLLTHTDIQCTSSGKTITEEKMIREGCNDGLHACASEALDETIPSAQPLARASRCLTSSASRLS